MTNFPPKVRQTLYRIQYIVSGIMLLIGVGYAASTTELPEWYGVTAAVLSALWTYTGITADRNVPATPPPVGDVPPPPPVGPQV
jgi:hypothetical protein